MASEPTFTELPNVRRVCAQTGTLKPKDGPNSSYEGVTLNYCAFRGQQAENVQMLSFRPYNQEPPGVNFDPAKQLGSCQLMEGQPTLYQDDTKQKCDTYLFNRQLPDDLMVQKPDLFSLASSTMQTLQPISKRTFDFGQDESDKLKKCRQACMNPYSNKCSHFYLKDNTCNLLYAGQKSTDEEPYNFGSSVGRRNESAFCQNGQVIDDYYQCQNAVKHINKFVNQDFFPDTDGNAKEYKYAVAWEGETDNPNVPYGCVLHYDYWADKNKNPPAYKVWFNKNKNNSTDKNGNYYKVCTTDIRSKHVIRSCPEGASYIMDENKCKALGNTMFFNEYTSKTQDDTLPRGCLAIAKKSSGGKIEGKLTLQYNDVEMKDRPENTKVQHFKVCDLYPNIEAAEFKPVLSESSANDENRFWLDLPPENGKVLPAYYVDRVQAMHDNNIRPAEPIIFSNTATTTCSNPQTFLGRVDDHEIVVSEGNNRGEKLSTGSIKDTTDCLKICKDNKNCKSFLFSRTVNTKNPIEVSGVCDLFSSRCEGEATLSSKQIEKTGYQGSKSYNQSDKCLSTQTFSTRKKGKEDCKATCDNTVGCTGYSQKGRDNCVFHTKDCTADVLTQKEIVPFDEAITQVFPPNGVQGFGDFSLPDVNVVQQYVRVNMD